MRKHEKGLIAKIQVAQLITDKPFEDDYYFQMKSLQKKAETLANNNSDNVKPTKSSKRKKKIPKWKESAGQLVDGKGNFSAISNQMQQQMKRLIESRRAMKPREGTCNYLI